MGMIMAESQAYFPQFVRERHSQLNLFDETQPEEGACLVAFRKAAELSEMYLTHGDMASFLQYATDKYASEGEEISYFTVGPGMFLSAVNLYAHCTGHNAPVTRDDLETFINYYPERVQELDMVHDLCEQAHWDPEELARLLENKENEV